MDNNLTIPPWVPVVSPLLSLAVTGVAWMFGKGSASGKQASLLKGLSSDMEGLKKVVSDTVISVSNHNQSIANMDRRMNSIDNELKQANVGIATLVERTKKL